MIAIFEILSGCSGRDHRDLNGCRRDRGRSDRTPQGPQCNGGWPGAAFLAREEWRRSRQGKKVADGRCGRTIEAEPVCDQTCHIEDVLAAPGLTNPRGSREWRAVIVSTCPRRRPPHLRHNTRPYTRCARLQPIERTAWGTAPPCAHCRHVGRQRPPEHASASPHATLFFRRCGRTASMLTRPWPAWRDPAARACAGCRRQADD